MTTFYDRLGQCFPSLQASHRPNVCLMAYVLCLSFTLSYRGFYRGLIQKPYWAISLHIFHHLDYLLKAMRVFCLSYYL